jgi:hypothetical protein
MAQVFKSAICICLPRSFVRRRRRSVLFRLDRHAASILFVRDIPPVECRQALFACQHMRAAGIAPADRP